MVGLDARELGDIDALALAQAWRAVQLAELRGNVERVIAQAELPAQAPLVGAGCGDFLVEALAAALQRPYRRFADLALAATDGSVRDEPALGRWAQVGAPSVAVALLCQRAGRRDF